MKISNEIGKLTEHPRGNPGEAGISLIGSLKMAALIAAMKKARAWTNFARTGNPSQPGLSWTPFDPARGQTMGFDNVCRMVDDPEGAVRKILLS